MQNIQHIQLTNTVSNFLSDHKVSIKGVLRRVITSIFVSFSVSSILYRLFPVAIKVLNTEFVRLINGYSSLAKHIPYYFIFILITPLLITIGRIIEKSFPRICEGVDVLQIWVIYYAICEVIHIINPQFMDNLYLVHKEWLKDAYNYVPWYIVSATFAFATYLLQEGVKYLKEKKDKMK